MGQISKDAGGDLAIKCNTGKVEFNNVCAFALACDTCPCAWIWLGDVPAAAHSVVESEESGPFRGQICLSGGGEEEQKEGV